MLSAAEEKIPSVVFAFVRETFLPDATEEIIVGTRCGIVGTKGSGKMQRKLLTDGNAFKRTDGR